MCLKILIVCNKKDYFLTRILIGSIKYYYPEIEIFIIKDYLNGSFNTTEMECFLNVKIMDLGIRKYGWSAAKMHFLFTKEFQSEKFLVLDSDIVFAGKFLEKLYEESKNFEIAVSSHPSENPYSEFVKKTYYSYDFLKSYSPSFEFPGYFFNGGQMIVTPGTLNPDEVSDFFDLSKFPYWKRLDLLPFVDQSLLNFILPLKEQKGEIKIYKGNFMVWSESKETLDLEMEKIKKGIEYPFLIHWAGAIRIPHLKKMTRNDILEFFEAYYYKQIPLGKLKRLRNHLLSAFDYYARTIYRGLKKFIVTHLGLKRDNDINV